MNKSKIPVDININCTFKHIYKKIYQQAAYYAVLMNIESIVSIIWSLIYLKIVSGA